MDSDIFIKKRFDSFIPEHGFATFHEHIGDRLKLQAAFLWEKKKIYSAKKYSNITTKGIS